MALLLLSILPLALGAAVTPTILVVQLANVAGPGGTRREGVLFTIGCLAMLLVVSVLALALANRTGGADSSGVAVATVKLVIAALLLAYGIHRLLRPRPKDREPKPARAAGGPGRQIGLGAAMMATNFTSLALYFPAMHEVGISGAGLAAQLVAFLVLMTITLLPATLPLLAPRGVREGMHRRLEQARSFMVGHPRLLPSLATVLGAYLAVLGLAKLL